MSRLCGPSVPVPVTDFFAGDREMAFEVFLPAEDEEPQVGLPDHFSDFDRQKRTHTESGLEKTTALVIW